MVREGEEKEERVCVKEGGEGRKAFLETYFERRNGKKEREREEREKQRFDEKWV